MPIVCHERKSSEVAYFIAGRILPIDIYGQQHTLYKIMQNMFHTKNPEGDEREEEGPHQNHAKAQSGVVCRDKQAKIKNNKNVSFVLLFLGVAKHWFIIFLCSIIILKIT